MADGGAEYLRRGDLWGRPDGARDLLPAGPDATAHPFAHPRRDRAPRCRGVAGLVVALRDLHRHADRVHHSDRADGIAVAAGPHRSAWPRGATLDCPVDGVRNQWLRHRQSRPDAAGAASRRQHRRCLSATVCYLWRDRTGGRALSAVRPRSLGLSDRSRHRRLTGSAGRRCPAGHRLAVSGAAGPGPVAGVYRLDLSAASLGAARPPGRAGGDVAEPGAGGRRYRPLHFPTRVAPSTMARPARKAV